jgi:hypothetical protein
MSVSGTPPTEWNRAQVSALLLGLFAGVAALALHAYPVCRPWLFDDDFAILADSWTWQAVRENLWQPWNEHAMPLGRILTGLLVQAAGPPTSLPRAAALQGPLALVMGMGLVYCFVGRELGHRLYGLLAMIAFGVTLKYNEAVFWFAASFSVLALDTTLLALVAAQCWRQTGNSWSLAACALWSALAPGWFAGGILAGAFCCLYLLPWRDRGQVRRTASRTRPLAAAVVPLLGTLAFLAVSLPRTVHSIEYADHYGGHSAWEIFAPLAGLELTGRTVVDNLVLGFNAFGRTCPRELVAVALVLLFLPAWWWWRQAPSAASRRLMALGGAFIVASYWLIYSFRAAWPYEAMMCGWTRYNLLPFLGLVFFLCGGLPCRQGSLFCLDTSGALTRKQTASLGMLIVLLTVCQFPQGLLGHLQRDRDREPQMAALRLVEETDARCRAHGIAATTARQALDRLDIPHSGDPEPRINGWDLLRGSDAPRPLTVQQARHLLAP